MFVIIFCFLYLNQDFCPILSKNNSKKFEYYFIYLLVIVFAQAYVSALFLTIYEVVHNLKIYDYISYCKFKFTYQNEKVNFYSNEVFIDLYVMSFK